MGYDNDIGVQVNSYEIDLSEGTITIEFIFKNNTGSSLSYFDSYCKDTVFQDGIECRYTYRDENSDTEIKSGKKVSIYKKYELNDFQAPVEIEFKNMWNENAFYSCTFDIINTGSKKDSSSVKPTDVDDSFKVNPNSFRDDKAVWVQRGLYFVFTSDIGSKKHNLWEIAKLAEKYSIDNGITADKYYRYFNEHWEYTLFPWCFCDAEKVVTEFPNENSYLHITGFDEEERIVTYSMIPFCEYSQYMSPFILSDIPGYTIPETATKTTTVMSHTTVETTKTEYVQQTTAQYEFQDFWNEINNNNDTTDRMYENYEGICSNDFCFELLFNDVDAAAKKIGVDSFCPADYWCIEWRTGNMSLAFYKNNYDSNWELFDRSEIKRVALNDISEYLNPELDTYCYIRSLAEYTSCPYGVEDSYKKTKFDEQPNFSDYGLYFIFGNDNNAKKHNLWELSLLAALHSNSTDMDADFFYRYLNEHWETTGEYWYIEDWTGREADLIIGEIGETKYIEYSRIPYSEYAFFQNFCFFQ